MKQASRTKFQGKYYRYRYFKSKNIQSGFNQIAFFSKTTDSLTNIVVPLPKNIILTLPLIVAVQKVDQKRQKTSMTLAGPLNLALKI